MGGGWSGGPGARGRVVTPGQRGARVRGRAEALRAQVAGRARALHDAHFTRAQRVPRATVAVLGTLVYCLRQVLPMQLKSDCKCKLIFVEPFPTL